MWHAVMNNWLGGKRLAMVTVGEVVRNASGHFVFEASIPESELWPGIAEVCCLGDLDWLTFRIAGKPRDGVASNSTEKIHSATTTVFVLLATAGIAFAAFCLFFNFHFRDKK